jgi:hypothetical protein
MYFIMWSPLKQPKPFTGTSGDMGLLILFNPLYESFPSQSGFDFYPQKCPIRNTFVKTCTSNWDWNKISNSKFQIKFEIFLKNPGKLFLIK